tara:strand:+ start:665 stop:1000 length:336 start_codon:yes stop_codon:yes gene_type:complete
MLQPYTPCPNGILGSLFPINEWWAFTGLYHKDQSWANWAIKHCSIDKVIVMMNTVNPYKSTIYLFGDWRLAIPMLKDAQRFFKVESMGKVKDYCPFAQEERIGQGFVLSEK